MGKRSLTLAILAALTLAAVAAGPWSAPAQTPAFPTRPITFIVGFSPGGGADVFARALAEGAKTALPQAIAVENRPGAGGTAAGAYAASRPADGHTILFAHAGSSIITPIITNQPTLKWDAFEPVARIHAEEEWLFGHPDGPWKTIDEVTATPRPTRRRSASPARPSAASTASWCSRGRRRPGSTSSTSRTRAAAPPPWPSSGRTPSS